MISSLSILPIVYLLNSLEIEYWYGCVSLVILSRYTKLSFWEFKNSACIRSKWTPEEWCIPRLTCFLISTQVHKWYQITSLNIFPKTLYDYHKELFKWIWMVLETYIEIIFHTLSTHLQNDINVFIYHHHNIYMKN